MDMKTRTFHKQTQRFRMACLGALVVLVSVTACSGVAAEADAPLRQGPVVRAQPGQAAPAATQALYQQLQQEIGNAACDAPAQCRTLAIGHKSCGGPERYAAWSTKAGNAARIEQLGADYAAARKADDTGSGMISNCMMVMDPGATCSAGRCVLKQGDPVLR